MERDWRRGVAASYDSSTGCTFHCRYHWEPAFDFLLTPLPAAAAGLFPYMAAACSQSAREKQLIQTGRESEGWELETEMNSIAPYKTKQPTSINAHKPACRLQTNQKSRGVTMQQSMAPLVNFTQQFRGYWVHTAALHWSCFFGCTWGGRSCLPCSLTWHTAKVSLNGPNFSLFIHSWNLSPFTVSNMRTHRN